MPDDMPATRPNSLLKTLERTLAHSSLLVSLGFAAQAAFSCYVLGLPVAMLCAAQIFCCALFIYTLDHAMDSEVQPSHDASQDAASGSGFLRVLCGASGVASLALAAIAPTAATAVVLSFLFLGAIYGVPLPFVGGRRLKDVPGLKAFYVAAVQVFAVVGLPLAWTGQPVGPEALAIAVFMFVFCATNVIAFDIRDVVADRAHGTKTLPVLLGVANTRGFLLGMNMALIAAIAFAASAGLAAGHDIAMACTLASVAYVLFVNERTERWVFGLVIDGVYMLPLLVFLGGS